MTGSNRRPSACKADALPAELILHLVTHTGFEPVLPPWKGGVLTAWPMGLLLNKLVRILRYESINKTFIQLATSNII